MFGLAKAVPLETNPVERHQPQVTMTLQEGIDELCRYGMPHMMKHDSGHWSCSVDMKIISAGASFEIKAGYGNKTLIEAVGLCVNNMHKALKDMGVS